MRTLSKRRQAARSADISRPSIKDQAVGLTFDPHSAHSPVAIEDVRSDVARMARVGEEGLDDEAAEIDPRLDSDDAPGRQFPTHPEVLEVRVCIGVVRMAAGVVGVQSEVVAEAVGEEGDAGLRLVYLFGRSGQDTQLQEPSDGDLVGVHVHVFPLDAFAQHIDAFFLHPQHDLVYLSAFLAELAADGKCPGDV